jgi:hypothetical protein
MLYVERIAIVQDTAGRWFVRRMESSTHDSADDVMRYVCDKHLAGPFDDVMTAATWVGEANGQAKGRCKHQPHNTNGPDHSGPFVFQHV